MLAYLFLILAVTVRFVPHVWNFTLVGAALLYFGAHRPRKQMWIAVAALAASDIVLTRFVNGFPISLETFSSTLYYALAVLIGSLLKENKEIPRVVGASLAGSVTFFLLSNFGTWVSYDMYPHTVSGLLTCYAMAVPFFRNTLVSDLVFSVAMFGMPMLVEALHRRKGYITAG
jgi:uncharacterized membrane protein